MILTSLDKDIQKQGACLKLLTAQSERGSGLWALGLYRKTAVLLLKAHIKESFPGKSFWLSADGSPPIVRLTVIWEISLFPGSSANLVFFLGFFQI